MAFFKDLISRRGPLLLAIYFAFVAIVPNLLLAYTEGYNPWVLSSSILLPLGIALLWSVVFRRSGIAILCSILFLSLSAVQIVLLYLFKGSIIAVDMFLNIATTNSSEASELLLNIYPSVIIVLLLYLPLLTIAVHHIIKKYRFQPNERKTLAVVGGAVSVLGLVLLVPQFGHNGKVVEECIYPVNTLYNLSMCADEIVKTKRYEQTSRDFSFEIEPSPRIASRRVFIYVIGEAARASNFQLYGYGRSTTPRLAQLLRERQIIAMREVTTMSNTTHKSVPRLLSAIEPNQHEALFQQKGLPALFSEAGYKTYFFSNQMPQGAMIDNIAHQADSVAYVDPNNRFDTQLLDMTRRVLATDTTHDILFILHTYGSHYNYHARYPREFAVFQPDDDVSITEANAEYIANAYDNTIFYTDSFLADCIALLRDADCSSALVYCSDHGEDLFDDRRESFLHSTPYTTCYQLHVPAILWFSEKYKRTYPRKIKNAERNSVQPLISRFMFHTMADIADIRSHYIDYSTAVTSNKFRNHPHRVYIDDRRRAVPLTEAGITDLDFDYFRQHRIDI